MPARPTARRSGHTQEPVLPARHCWVVFLLSLCVLGLPVDASDAVPPVRNGGLDQRAQADAVAGTAGGRLVWRFRTGGAVRSTADLARGVLYIGGSDGLYALNAADGRLRWRCDLGNAVGSPTVRDGRVYVWDASNRLHALDAADGSRLWGFSAGADRQLRWGYEGWDYLLPAPAVSGSTVFAGGGDGVLYALDIRDGSLRWRFTTEGRLRATPVVDRGTIFIGSGDGRLYAVDAGTGTERWHFETEGAALNAADFGYDRTQIMGAAAVTEERVYFGSRDARLYALRRDTGEEIWRVEEESAWIIAAPTIASDVLYSTRSSSRHARAIDPRSGEEQWMVELDGFIFASPVIVGDRLYAATGKGTLYGLDRSGGEILWRFQTGGGLWGTPVADRGRLYFGSDDGSVYAVSDAADYRPPERAVFWDEEHARTGYLLSRADAGRALKDALAGSGYEALDVEAALHFLRMRRGAGVIVFAIDAVGQELESALRPYLHGGGRAVWIGIPPAMLERDISTGTVVRLDRERSTEFLDVDLTAWNGDIYPAMATGEGHVRGLAGFWIASSGAMADSEGLVVLGRDAKGRPVAWVRHYASGGQFVYLGVRSGALPACQVALVAEYGLTHAGSSESAPACGIPR